MKRAFTLIELLIVVAMLVMLLTFVFKIGGVAGNAEAKATTVKRMQCIENCFSGFHAAFGSYPPVRLYNNRDFRRQVDDRQQPLTLDWGNENEAWEIVEKVCKAQPLACKFPTMDGADPLIKEWSEFCKLLAAEMPNMDPDERRKLLAGFMPSGTSSVEGKLRAKREKFLWEDIQLFQFGVMSYLLPRYLLMMGGADSFYSQLDQTGRQGVGGNNGYAQWSKNNDMPCCPYCGFPGDECLCPQGWSWDTIRQAVKEYRDPDKVQNRSDLPVRVLSVPSQAVCARWLPNLEGICDCLLPRAAGSLKVFGIDPYLPGDAAGIKHPSMFSIDEYRKKLCQCIYSPNEGSNSDQYLLEYISVLDGWRNEFYYYSRSPYQSYTLWSAGQDGKTYPPWIPRDRISDAKEMELAAKWTADDIVQLKN